MTSSPASSRGVIRADDPTFAFQTSNLPDVLARKFQPDTSPHAICFFDDDHAKMFQGARHRLDIWIGWDPSAAASLYQLQRVDGYAGGCSEVWLADADQGPRRSDQTASKPNSIIHLRTPFLRGSIERSRSVFRCGAGNDRGEIG